MMYLAKVVYFVWQKLGFFMNQRGGAPAVPSVALAEHTPEPQNARSKG